MKCSNCGFEFDEGIFCPECGTKFDNNANIQHEEEQKNIEDNPNVKEDSAIMDVPFENIFGDIFGDLFEKKAGSTTTTQETSGNENTSNEEFEPSKKEKKQIEQVESKTISNDGIEPKSQSVMGILSFVIGILSFCCIGFILVPEIIGLVLGIKGKKDTEHKTGLAKAGFIINIISLILWVLILVLLFNSDSSNTSAVEKQVVENTIEQDSSEKVENVKETKEDSKKDTEDKESTTEIENTKSVESTDVENVKEEVSDTTDTKYEYSNEDICNMCSDYYLSLYGAEPPYAIVDHEDGNTVTIQLCEEIDEDGYGYNSLTFYTINRDTLEGYDDILGERVDLKKASGDSSVSNKQNDSETDYKTYTFTEIKELKNFLRDDSNIGNRLQVEVVFDGYSIATNEYCFTFWDKNGNGILNFNSANYNSSINILDQDKVVICGNYRGIENYGSAMYYLLDNVEIVNLVD